jgi:phenol 2-monooxygenase (NADPH)
MVEPRNNECVDVLICGSGSAGLACALWLAIYNNRFCKRASDSTPESARGESTTHPITYRLLEARDGPLQVGQADGVQCRTLEIYESLGLDHLLKNEGYWVNEVAFWAVDEADQVSNAVVNGHQESARKKIVRTGRTADVQRGLSHQPHVILNQARINGLLIEKMQGLKGRDVDYGWKVTGLEVEEATNEQFPVKVTAEKHGLKRTVRAKYVLGGDGAHSQVRHSVQIPMEGDSSDAVWGVMDVFPRTDFPDVRKKTTIRSEAGSLMIIPREGDMMIRLYFELPEGTDPKKVTLSDLQRTAKEMFYPYTIEFLATKWWSAYSIGQRVAKSMVDESGHVFLGGDACHTHSPKAGQGMNASLQDGYNLGWKLGALLTGQANETILSTYIQERHQYAQQLIDFDRYFAGLFSSKTREDGRKVTSEEFNQAFIRAGVFTAGMAANYHDSDLVAGSLSKQSLASRTIIGQRLPSPQVVRMSDSKAFPLLKLLQSDGRWRIIVFPGDIDGEKTRSRLNQVGEELASQQGLLETFTPKGMKSDSIFDTLVVFQGDRKKLEFDQIHDTFEPEMHDLPINNLHKIFFDDESWNWGHGHAYENLGIDSKQGCIVIARPDQYVSAVIGLEDLHSLPNWFAGLMRNAKA